MSASCLLSLVLAALLFLSTSAQPYSPFVSPATTASACSGSTLVSLGTDAASQFTRYLVTANELYLSSYNNSISGATISQLSLTLGDNSALSTPTSLRLGLYSVSASGSTASVTLVGNTAEITLYPSGPQTLYAALLTPTTLAAGGQYAVGFYAGTAFYVMGGGKGPSYLLYSSFVDFQMPVSGSGLSLSTFYQFGGAAYGCQGAAGTVPAGSQVFAFCAYVESYQPSPSTSDYTQVSITTTTTMSGTLIASTTSTSSSFGSGYAVTSGSGSVSVYRSGAESYYEPYVGFRQPRSPPSTPPRFPHSPALSVAASVSSPRWPAPSCPRRPTRSPACPPPTFSTPPLLPPRSIPTASPC